MEPLIVVGVDAAAQDENVAVARAVAGERIEILEILPSCRAERPSATVARWLRGASRAVVAIDAPLGWPAALARELPTHMAGELLAAAPNELFRRITDIQIKARLGKQPLDIGADRIARAAHAALVFMSELRSTLGVPLPLAWSPGRIEEPVAIEVYPAATLRASGVDPGRYKKTGAEGAAARADLVAWLERILILPRDRIDTLKANDDSIDAVIAAMAGADFAAGVAIPPTDAELPVARREGWIWTRPAPSAFRSG